MAFADIVLVGLEYRRLKIEGSVRYLLLVIRGIELSRTIALWKIVDDDGQLVISHDNTKPTAFLEPDWVYRCNRAWLYGRTRLCEKWKEAHTADYMRREEDSHTLSSRIEADCLRILAERVDDEDPLIPPFLNSSTYR